MKKELVWGIGTLCGGLFFAAGSASAQVIVSSPGPADGWTTHYRIAESLDASAPVLFDFYCKSMLQNAFGECQVFENNSADARLIGIEMIIDAQTYGALSLPEQKLWKSHGQDAVQFPDFTDAEQSLLLNAFRSTYGKFYLLWNPALSDLPQGLPSLIPSPASAPPAAALAAPQNNVQVLSLGTKGDAVRALQNVLITLHLLAADMATGFYGLHTVAAVRAFQKKEGVTPTGSFGPKSFAKLRVLAGSE